MIYPSNNGIVSAAPEADDDGGEYVYAPLAFDYQLAAAERNMHNRLSDLAPQWRKNKMMLEALALEVAEEHIPLTSSSLLRAVMDYPEILQAQLGSLPHKDLQEALQYVIKQFIAKRLMTPIHAALEG